MKKLLIIGLLVTLVFGASVAVAQVLIEEQIPARVTVVGVPQAEGLSFWWDEACTQPVELLDFGEVEAGQKSEWVEFYVLNETSLSFSCLAHFDVLEPKGPQIFMVAMFTPYGDNDNDFDPGEVGWMALGIAVVEGTPEGIIDFTVTITPVEI